MLETRTRVPNVQFMQRTHHSQRVHVRLCGRRTCTTELKSSFAESRLASADSNCPCARSSLRRAPSPAHRKRSEHVCLETSEVALCQLQRKVELAPIRRLHTECVLSNCT